MGVHMFPEPPSHLPPYPIPLGHPRAPFPFKFFSQLCCCRIFSRVPLLYTRSQLVIHSKYSSVYLSHVNLKLPKFPQTLPP